MATWPEARAARAERLLRQRRHYTPDLLGAPCAARCGLRVPRALIEAGIHTHPTCGPDAALLLAREVSRA